MKQKRYSAAALCKDEAFVQWVFHPDEMSNTYWGTYLDKYPEQRETVRRARTMLLAVKDNSGTEGIQRDRDRMEVLQRLRETRWEDSGPREEQYTDNKVIKLPVKGKGKGKGLLIAVGFSLVLGLGLYKVYEWEFAARAIIAEPPQITLQLQDGSQQVIDESDTRIITTKEGLTLGNQDKHILKYHNTQQDATKELAYNELTVPYGKNFELVLSDSSHIYLNAGSTLRFPVQFLPDQPRDVYLDGEAYFVVASDKTRPFTVHTEQMATQVYGTRFNVTSYKNEGNTYTVLEEGSVGVYPPEADESAPVKIVPGQRAVMENGRVAVEEVRVEKYVAWTRGELYFRNDPFALILKKLERHFNVSIASNYAELDQMEFIVTFKGQTLEEILNAFQEYTPFHYTREGNTITITPPH